MCTFLVKSAILMPYLNYIIHPARAIRKAMPYATLSPTIILLINWQLPLAERTNQKENPTNFRFSPIIHLNISSAKTSGTFPPSHI